METLEKVKNHISQHYSNWREYAVFQSIHAEKESDAEDVLNEVVYAILNMKPEKLAPLINTKAKRKTKSMKNMDVRELDYYALRMIKLNLTSKTAPWLFKKNKLIPKKDIHIRDKIDETEQAIQTTEMEGFRLDVYKNFIENMPLLNACERAALRYRTQHTDYQEFKTKEEKFFFRSNTRKAQIKIQKSLKIKQL